MATSLAIALRRDAVIKKISDQVAALGGEIMPTVPNGSDLRLQQVQTLELISAKLDTIPAAKVDPKPEPEPKPRSKAKKG